MKLAFIPLGLRDNSTPIACLILSDASIWLLGFSILFIVAREFQNEAPEDHNSS